MSEAVEKIVAKIGSPHTFLCQAAIQSFVELAEHGNLHFFFNQHRKTH
jgi:hypothetical protein